MRHRFVVHNGLFLPENARTVPAKHLLAAIPVFIREEMFAAGTRVVMFGDHCAGIREQLRKNSIPWPSSINENSLHKIVTGLMNRNKIFQGARITLLIYPGDRDSQKAESSFLVFAEPADHEKYHLNEKGLVADIYPYDAPRISSLDRPAPLIQNIMRSAGEYAARKSIDDCFILNDRGYLAGAGTGNIMIAKNNRLIVPGLKDCLQQNILTTKILELCRSEKIETDAEASVDPSFLKRADEVMITHPLFGIRWILAYNKIRYYCRMAKHLTDRLNEELLPV